jgi:hypothetical protein
LFFVATSYYVKLVYEKLDSALQLFKSKL